MRESEKLLLRPIRQACGLSIAELARITEVSRNTVYALEGRRSVRRSTVIAMLQVMASHDRFIAARKDVREELRRLNVREPEVSRVELLFDQLRALKQHLERLDELGYSAPRIADLKSFQKDWTNLVKAGEAVLRNQQGGS